MQRVPCIASSGVVQHCHVPPMSSPNPPFHLHPHTSEFIETMKSATTPPPRRSTRNAKANPDGVKSPPPSSRATRNKKRVTQVTAHSPLAPRPLGNPTSPPLFPVPEATVAGNTLAGADPSFRSPGKGGLRAERPSDASTSMPTASALEVEQPSALDAKQPPTVSEVAVAASDISAADALFVALSDDFNDEEQGSTAARASDAAISMHTASALEAKQPPTVSEVAVAASSISPADASAVALSADFDDEQSITAARSFDDSPADLVFTLKKVGEYCLKPAAPADGIVRVSEIIDRF